jgi:hypothetical protein
MDPLPSAPITLFEERFAIFENDEFALVETSSGKTVKIKAKYVTFAQPSTNYKWVSTFDYPVDAIVEYQGKWYLSLQTPNLGKIPSSPANAAFWQEQVKAGSGFVFWVAGVYTGAEVFVLRALDQFVQIFRLSNATRPFLSTDFEVEYAAGDWELMSERGYVGISKAAHGFSVNDVLTFKAGAWNKFTTGDTPLAIVRNVVSANLVIVVLLGFRLKGLSGLAAGSSYYAQSDGTISTIASANVVFLAVSATEAILLTSGGGASGTDHFKGVFASEAALGIAFPTADEGDYAFVDTGGDDAALFIWDDTDVIWVESGITTVVPDADGATKGIAKLYTTPNGTNTDGAVSQAGINAKLRSTRTLAVSGATVQTDDNLFLKFNSATPINFTVDQLTADSKIPYVNYGAGAVTLVAGTGVTLVGRTVIPGAIDTDYPGGVLVYDTATSVRNLSGPPKEPEVVTAAVAAGAVTLDLDMLYQRKFEDTALQTGAFTITFDDEDNAQVFTYSIRVNGTVPITLPASVVMEEGDTRFVNGTKILTLIGSTKRFLLSFNRLAVGVFHCATTDTIYNS